MMSKIKRQALLDNLNPNVASNKDNGVKSLLVYSLV